MNPSDKSVAACQPPKPPLSILAAKSRREIERDAILEKRRESFRRSASAPRVSVRLQENELADIQSMYERMLRNGEVHHGSGDTSSSDDEEGGQSFGGIDASTTCAVDQAPLFKSTYLMSIRDTHDWHGDLTSAHNVRL